MRIEAAANGPLLVRGEVTVIDAAGNETRHLEKVALCRCGGSSRKPFCDGSHKTNGFQG
ncbi:MAG: CDGSH iron-sulfur domain-containing protein [Candidatus Eisenbacteria bacterium]